MTWTYAGQYSDDVLYKTRGPVASTAITITTSTGSPATLYTDATKATPLGSNVVTTDSDGNLEFFADPGTYTCTSVTFTSFLAVVGVNPLEFPSDPEGFATTAALAAETTRAETAEGTLTTSCSTNASAITAETTRAVTAEGLKAPLASPAFTGNPTATTQAAGDASTKIATDAFVAAATAYNLRVFSV